MCGQPLITFLSIFLTCVEAKARLIYSWLLGRVGWFLKFKIDTHSNAPNRFKAPNPNIAFYVAFCISLIKNLYNFGTQPLGRYNSCGFIYNQKLYIYGGIGSFGVYNDLWSYDLAQGSWAFLGKSTQSSSCVISIRN